MNIEIQQTNNTLKTNCPGCGIRFRPDIQVWAFYEDKPVCENCIELHAPDVLADIKKRQQIYPPFVAHHVARNGGSQKPKILPF